jgi:Kef-type K+ transport system membrane component KefB
MSIALCIFGATILGLIFHYLKQPLILAYIVTGILLGPTLGLGLIKDHHDIQMISEIGLIVMMFILGLSIQLPHLLRAGRIVLISSSFQIFGCFIIGGVFFYYWHPSFVQTPYEIFYLSVALAISSTALVIKILSDRHEIGRLSSRITLGILICQDFFVIVLLGFQPSFSDPHLVSVLFSFVKIALLIAIAWLGTKYLLVKIYQSIAKQMELMVIVSLGWCFFLVGTFHLLGLSKEMGALVAGLCLASFPYNQDVITKLSSLRDFFITLFFVSLGLQFPPLQASVVIPAFIIVGLIIFTRLLTLFPSLLAMKLGGRTSFITTLNLSQLSEFTLVFTSLGLTYNHIGQQTMDILIISMILASILTPYLIQHGFKIFKIFAILTDKAGLKVQTVIPMNLEELTKEPPQPKVILLGIYHEGSALLEDLLEKYSEKFKSELLVVDFNPHVHHTLKSRNISCVYGDFSHIGTLRQLPLDHANIIVCTVQDYMLRGTSNRKLLITLKRLAPQAKIIVTAETIKGALSFYEQGAEYVIIPRTIVGSYLADVLEAIRSGNASKLQENALAYLKKRKEVLE